ncbi:Transmembrane protein [Operophtera brumata]|uniref:Transmembrane protein n=1 Tax=Operophtera brumata TaxID=104452 RepID=A0A0L7KYP9_OPEBR|nr:Transmembrane protein [Operophtera brumata]
MQTYVIALICGLLVVILMVLGLASADWLMAAGWRQGLFMHCIDPGAPLPLPFDITAQPGCYAARPATYINIEAVRRLGRRDGGKTRPIVMTLLTMGLKIQIQKNKKKLENTPYYIKEDYPPEILNKRKELQIQLEKEREQGKMAFIKIS